MDWRIAVITLILTALIITVTVLMMRHREKMRAVAREAESLNVLSNDKRRASWISAADSSATADNSASSGGGDESGD